MKEEKIADEIVEKLTEYVYKNYKSMNGKKLYIQTLGEKAFGISTHIDASPLILSKEGIL